MAYLFEKNPFSTLAGSWDQKCHVWVSILVALWICEYSKSKLNILFEPATQWNFLKLGGHTPSIERKRFRIFFRFFLWFLKILVKFQGTFPYMSFFSRTARWIILKFGHKLCLTSALMSLQTPWGQNPSQTTTTPPLHEAHCDLTNLRPSTDSNTDLGHDREQGNWIWPSAHQDLYDDS